MRVVYEHQVFSLQRYGGISRYFVELAYHLKKMGNDVNIYSPLYINDYLLLDKYRSLTKGIYFPFNIKGLESFSYKINSILQKVSKFKDIDILHKTYYGNNSSTYGRARVLTVFDMIAERLAINASGVNAGTITKQKSVERAEHIICISKQTQNDLIELFGVDKNKTSVIYLGHSLTQCISNEVDLDSNSKPFILYVGKRNGYKNFNIFIDSYSDTPMLRNAVNIACFGGGEFSDEEIERFKYLGISKNVSHVTGGDNILSSYYKAALAFIYPSLYEGFGIPPLEAMSYDCPVICSNSSSIPEVVGDSGLYFSPSSEDEIINAMNKIIFDESVRDKLISRGRERVKKFTWEKTAVETQELYESLI